MLRGPPQECNLQQQQQQLMEAGKTERKEKGGLQHCPSRPTTTTSAFKRPLCHSPATHPPTAMLTFNLFSPLTALASDMDSNLKMPETPPTPKRCLLKDLTAETPPIFSSSSGRIAAGIFGKSRPFTRNNTTFGRVESSSFSINPLVVTTSSSSATSSSSSSFTATRDKLVEFAKPRPLDPSIFLSKKTSTVHWNARAPLVKPPTSKKPQQLQHRLQQSLCSTLTGDHSDPMIISSSSTSTSSSSSSSSSSSTFPPPNKMRRMNSLDSITVSSIPTTNNSSSIISTTELSSMSSQLMSVPGEVYDLPCYYGADAMKRITPDTLSQLLDGHFADKCDEVHVIDCRFPYEFQGGHISSAKNIYTLEDLEHSYFADHVLPLPGKRVIVVMHCEYSAQRAPRMAKYMRNHDRSLNASSYPNLHYPQIYILDGGYRSFFNIFKDRCRPQSYIEMRDKGFKSQYAKCMSMAYNNNSSSINHHRFRKAASLSFF